MGNDQYVIFYISKVPAINDEPEAVYQGKIEKVVSAVEGYTPTREDIYNYMPTDVEIDTIMAMQVCLN